MPENVTSTIECIDPELATMYLADCAFPDQRPLKEWHVEEYAQYMRRGEWRPHTVVRFDAHDGKLYLIDGQHRLAAVARAGIPQQFVVVTRQCATLEEAVADYVAMDTGKLRTTTDAMAAAKLPERLLVNSWALKQIDAATRLIERDFADHGPKKLGYQNRSRVRMEGRIIDWAPYAKKLFEACPRSNAYNFKRRELLSVAFVTFRYQADKSRTFWGAVSLNDGLRSNTPEWRLVQYLQSDTCRADSVAERCRKIASAWNAYFNGVETLGYLAAREAKYAIKIEGTPYNGTRTQVQHGDENE